MAHWGIHSSMEYANATDHKEYLTISGQCEKCPLFVDSGWCCIFLVRLRSLDCVLNGRRALRCSSCCRQLCWFVPRPVLSSTERYSARTWRYDAAMPSLDSCTLLMPLSDAVGWPIDQVFTILVWNVDVRTWGQGLWLGPRCNIHESAHPHFIHFLPSCSHWCSNRSSADDYAANTHSL